MLVSLTLHYHLKNRLSNFLSYPTIPFKIFSFFLQIVLFALISACFAASIGVDSTTEKKEVIPVLSFETDKKPDGSFSFSYEGGDRSFREETGVVENAGTDDEALEVSGSYRYIDSDGQEVEVHYTAGKNGFVPVGTNILSEISALARAAADLPNNVEEQSAYRKARSKDLKEKENVPEKKQEPERKVEKENVPEKKTEKEKVPEKKVEKVNVAAKKVEKENVPEKKAEKENVPEKKVEKENVAEKKVEKENVLEKKTEPEKKLEKTAAPEKKAEKEVLPKKETEKEHEPAKKEEKDHAPEKKVEKESVPEKKDETKNKKNK